VFKTWKHAARFDIKIMKTKPFVFANKCLCNTEAGKDQAIGRFRNDERFC